MASGGDDFPRWPDKGHPEDPATEARRPLWRRALPDAAGDAARQRAETRRAKARTGLDKAPIAEPVPGAPVEALADRVELLDLAAVLSTPPEAIDWMWGEGERGYIEAGTLTLLNAAGGAGKSMLAIALARAVQRGEALLGQPTRRGNVAYLEPEDVMSTADRLAAVLHALEEAGYLPQTGEEPDA